MLIASSEEQILTSIDNGFELLNLNASIKLYVNLLDPSLTFNFFNKLMTNEVKHYIKMRVNILFVKNVWMWIRERSLSSYFAKYE